MALAKELNNWGGSDLKKKYVDINSRELISLLWSSYGAMFDEVDFEIYSLMHEIESNDRLKSRSIATMDYLWGSSALRIRKERVQELEISANNILDAEAVEERQRSQFRENLPIDPKLCMNTVLYFPYNRTASDGPISLNKVHPDNVKDMIQVHSRFFNYISASILFWNTVSMVYVFDGCGREFSNNLTDYAGISSSC